MPVGPENFLATIAIATILSLLALAALARASKAPKGAQPELLMTWSSNAIQLAAILLLFSSIGLTMTVLASCMKVIEPTAQISTTEPQEIP